MFHFSPKIIVAFAWSTTFAVKLNIEDPLHGLFDASPEGVVKTCQQLVKEVHDSINSARKNALFAKGAVEITVSALERFPGSPEVQNECQWFMSQLADHQPDIAPKRKICLAVGKSGAIEAAIAAMRRFPNNRDLQAGTSILFGCISDNTPENLLILAKHEAHKLSESAVRRFPEQWKIWGGLAGMSAEPSIAQYLYDQGIIDHIKHVVLSNNTRHAERLRTEALCVLTVMSHSVPKTVDDMVNAGLIPEVIINLKEDPTMENWNNAMMFLDGVIESSAAGRTQLLQQNILNDLVASFPMGRKAINKLGKKLDSI